MPVVVIDSKSLERLNRFHAESEKDCLMDFVSNEFKFVEGENCDSPPTLKEVGAGVTLRAVMQMMNNYINSAGEEKTICIDYGRNIFESLLFNEGGERNNCQGIRFYFGLKPNKNGDPEINLILVPLDADSCESKELKNISLAQKAADDVGHGTNKKKMTGAGSDNKYILFHLAR